MAFFAKITTKEHYGLRLALQLAKTYYSETPVSLTTVSKEENISLKYLEQLILPFKKANWITSSRGREGGYVMVKDPAKISLKDLVSILDDDISIVECLCSVGKKKCGLDSVCRSKAAWSKVQKAIEKSLEDIKFSELIKN